MICVTLFCKLRELKNTWENRETSAKFVRSSHGRVLFDSRNAKTTNLIPRATAYWAPLNPSHFLICRFLDILVCLRNLES